MELNVCFGEASFLFGFSNASLVKYQARYAVVAAIMIPQRSPAGAVLREHSKFVLKDQLHYHQSSLHTFRHLWGLLLVLLAQKRNNLPRRRRRRLLCAVIFCFETIAFGAHSIVVVQQIVVRFRNVRNHVTTILC